jgi:hypothetical protein
MRTASIVVAIAVVPGGLRGVARADVATLGVVAEARVDRGTDESVGLDLETVGIGVQARPTSMLAIAAFALGMTTSGVRSDGARATGSLGGELALALRPFPRWPVRPYLHASAGMLLFPDAPFLPMGDVYDFVLHVGIGADVPITPRLVLAVHFDRAHVSNGQGLDAQNPSFDGYGLGAELAYAVAEPHDSDPDPELRPSPPSAGVAVDGELANANGWLEAGRVRAATQLASTLRGQLDVEIGSLADHGFVEAGIDVLATDARGTIAAHLGARDYVGIYTGVVQLQGELAVTAETSVVVTGVWEPSNFQSALLAAAGLRVRPHRDVSIDAGEAVIDAAGNPVDHALYFDAEWRIGPAAVFYERQLAGLNLAGLRWYGGARAIWKRLR